MQMRSLLAVLVLSLSGTTPAAGSINADPDGFAGRPVSTYSIVARDPGTGRIGDPVWRELVPRLAESRLSRTSEATVVRIA